MTPPSTSVPMAIITLSVSRTRPTRANRIRGGPKPFAPCRAPNASTEKRGSVARGRVRITIGSRRGGRRYLLASSRNLRRLAWGRYDLVANCHNRTFHPRHRGG